MSSGQATKEALTIVDTLKLCILKQDKVIRAQNEEIQALKSRVEELEREKERFRYVQSDSEVPITSESRQRSEAASSDPSSKMSVERNGGIVASSQNTTPEEVPAPTKKAVHGVSITEESPPSPTIIITQEGGQSCEPTTPKLLRRETLNKVKHSDSITRTKSFSKRYELSPELQDRSVRFLERQYGGKAKANAAASVIQMHYRKYAMNKRFQRMRTYSSPGIEFKARQKAMSDPNKLRKSEVVQTTPVIKIRKRRVASQENQRVRSILIIDNINSPSGNFYSEAIVPTELSSVRTSLEKRLIGSGQETAKGELDIVEDIHKEAAGKDRGQQGSITSETEHYVKVEVIEELETLPDEDTNKESLDLAARLPNGDITRTRRLTTGEDSEFDSGDDISLRQGFTSSVDSIDAVSATHLVSEFDEDSFSLSSEYEPMHSSRSKPQRIEMRIGINHFNRKPEKGIDYLLTHQVLEDNSEVVAKFLLSEPGISKQKLGEYLGNLQNEFNMEVLKCFVENLDFTGMEVDEALRLFQTEFRLPGEAQKIERIMEAFAEQYISCHPTNEPGAQDAILVLAFAIVMLNVDLHSPNVKNRMTEKDFIRNLKGTNNGGDFPTQSLLEIYGRIKKKSFNPGKDHMSDIEKLGKKIVGKCPWTTLVAFHRQLRMLTPMYEVRDPNKKEKPHPRIVFLFNDMFVITKERGRAGQRQGLHYYAFKASFSLSGVKVSTYSNDYYRYGIQLYSKLDSKVLVNLNCKDEDTRKVFVDELLECIEETNAMESDRITTEKRRQLGTLFARAGSDRVSLTLPKKEKQFLPSLDTISLIDTSGSIDSLECSSELMTSKHLSNSMLDISGGDGLYPPEGLGKRSSSVTSLDSVFVDALDIAKPGGKAKKKKKDKDTGKKMLRGYRSLFSLHPKPMYFPPHGPISLLRAKQAYHNGNKGSSSDIMQSMPNLHKKSLFGKWRRRDTSRSMGKPSPNPSPLL